MGELLSASPQVDWLIDDVLPAKGRAMLYAAEKTGKSFVVLDMALHIATGKPWQGRAVKQGAVYYVASENAETFYERVQAWQKLHGGLTAETPFYLIPRAYNLLQPTQVAELVGKLGPASLVIIDTLGRSMDGGDENSNSDMNRVATAMDAIRDATGAAVLLVHHTGNETPRRKKNGAETPQRARGASALRGMVGTSIHLTRGGQSGAGFADGSEITLTCQAQTRGNTFWPITLHVKLVNVARGVVVPAIISVSEDIDALWAAGVRDRAELARRTGKSREAVKKYAQRHMGPVAVAA